ncbi:MAG: pantoate--beta-alanine ligase [Candidatus Marinimicrobia bacterium CG08_land_8_20_14_0_20_45_22]|nr:MAG: pantoate--beta-alanine ligase [Candidatus Marinimicrobia bacterium CG08_land_8_20_14_0_20_45_22]
MRVVSSIPETREILREIRLAGKSVGLVPTMGYLHEGHLSLVDEAKKRCNFIVMSIFVNPTQFGPNEDLDKYPRDFERDEKLAQQRGVDLIFYPNVAEMYPKPYFTYVMTEQLSKTLCGASRPIHFRGVTTIVSKLFNIVQPDIAVFGQKDAQQAIIIRRMVDDLNFPVQVVVAPIVREADGLAMSSRNVYLSPEERQQAPIIFRALKSAKELVLNGNRDALAVAELIRRTIGESRLAEIEYIEIVNSITLENVQNIESGNFVAVAVRFGKTRLIDNLVLID